MSRQTFVGQITARGISAASGNALTVQNSTPSNILEVPNAGELTIRGTGTTSGTFALTVTNSTPTTLFRITNQGYIEVTDSSFNQSFGINRTGVASTSLAIGVSTSARASCSGPNGVSIGRATNSSAQSAIAIGDGVTASGTYSISIGTSGNASGSNSIRIGNGNVVTNNDCIILGSASDSNAVQQFIAAPITEVYFGNGPRPFNTSGLSYSINGSGGGTSGNDLAGGNITIAGGRGVGAGTPGSIIFSTSTALTSGATFQSLTERMRISGTILVLADGFNIQTNATTGTKICTATTQKVAFWNAAPIAQPTTAVASSTLVGGGGTTLTSTDTFDGYTLAQVVKALRNIGLLA